MCPLGYQYTHIGTEGANMSILVPDYHYTVVPDRTPVFSNMSLAQRQKAKLVWAGCLVTIE